MGERIRKNMLQFRVQKVKLIFSRTKLVLGGGAELLLTYALQGITLGRAGQEGSLEPESETKLKPLTF